MKTCKDCKLDKDESAYRIKDRVTKRLSNYCHLCEDKRSGIKNPGILSQTLEHFKNGQRKCCDCKVLKSLDSFSKNKSGIKGYSSVCKECSNKRTYKYIRDSRTNLTSHYLKRFAIKNYNIKYEDLTPEILEIAKLHVQTKRSDKLFLDGLQFNTVKSFARYVSKNYNLSIACVAARIRFGHTEQECTIPEHDFRSKSRTKIEKIVVTNVITNEVRSFLSKYKATVELNITVPIIQRCLDTGEIRKPYRNSKNKDLLKFEYAK